MRANCVGLAGALAVSLPVAAVGAGDAGTLIPIVKQRYTETLVVSICEGKTLIREEVLDCDPFESLIENDQSCEGPNFGFTTAVQQSDICGSLMTGSGSATAEAGTPGPNHIHAAGVSVYFLKFEVTAASSFTVNGEISAAGGRLIQENRAEMVLVVGDLPLGEPIFEYTLDPSPTGEPVSEVIEEAGVLDPGEYTFYAEAIATGLAFVGSPVDDEASFDFTFEIGAPCREDLDGNGEVDFGDILAILAAWGNKGGPEDLDGSGIVDFGDLLIVLAAWGPCE